METLSQMLEDYRNGERGLPSYDELVAINEATQEEMAKAYVRAVVSKNRADKYKSELAQIKFDYSHEPRYVTMANNSAYSILSIESSHDGWKLAPIRTAKKQSC